MDCSLRKAQLLGWLPEAGFQGGAKRISTAGTCGAKLPFGLGAALLSVDGDMAAAGLLRRISAF